jgi:V/A-type H+/Na+-transporting ATPase subunit K
MEQSVLNMVGPAIALALPAIGSCYGCGIAGLAAHAAMARVEEGHGKFIGMAAAPSSQIIYGFILMVLMKNSVLEGSITPYGAIGVALFIGTAIMLSSYWQGKVCAAGIQAAVKQPAVYGKCFAAIGIIESFSLFAFVFALALI